MRWVSIFFVILYRHKVHGEALKRVNGLALLVGGSSFGVRSASASTCAKACLVRFSGKAFIVIGYCGFWEASRMRVDLYRSIL